MLYSRIIKFPNNKSFFIFGPRGTGKTTYLRNNFSKALFFDLLEAETFNKLSANPSRLENLIPDNFKNWVVIDEVQKIPKLLDEVHRLIESRKLKFILTGSSARKIKKAEVNLLAGRALSYSMYPLTALELKKDFELKESLLYGHLPSVFQEKNPKKYLEAYVATYLKQEVQQEGLTQNLEAFSRFLETASFSQGQVLNLSDIARESHLSRRMVENYFTILEDLMIGCQLPVFRKKAKRSLIGHSKFYFFDVGIFRILKPRGPLDLEEEIEGASLETLVFQEIRAVNDCLDLDYKLFFWRTIKGEEVDFVLYGEKGLLALEVKRTNKISPKHLRGLKLFRQDYPMAQCYLIYSGKEEMYLDNVKIVPIDKFLKKLDKYLTESTLK